MHNGMDQNIISTSRRDFLKTAAVTSMAAVMAGACQTTGGARMSSLALTPGPEENAVLFDGIEMDLGTLSRLSNARTRYLSSAQAMDKKDAKKRPVPGVAIQPGETLEMASIDGPGALQHLWVLPTGSWRFMILRVYWDHEERPSIESPIGDFFGQGWGNYAPITSPPVGVNAGNGFNCYWVMPFRKHCRITVENIGFDSVSLAYHATYVLNEIPADAAYLHAQFRRTNPLPEKEVFTILDDVKGWGHYVGTYMAWGVHNTGWWGEGEIKFYLDGDSKFPTLCGTGTEDYFCGSYNFDRNGQYTVFSTPYAGLHQVIKPDGSYRSQQRFGLYRWHLMDPIRFEDNLRVTIQALGWRAKGRYLPLRDDLASVAFWYQTEPHAKFPVFPQRNALEVI